MIDGFAMTTLNYVKRKFKRKKKLSKIEFINILFFVKSTESIKLKKKLHFNE